MNITAFDIWFITRLDPFSSFLLFMALASAFATLIFTMVWHFNFDSYDEKDRETASKNLKMAIRAAITFVILSFLFVCVPSTKTATAMYFIPKVMQSEVVQHLPDYAKQLMDKVLGVDIDSVIKDTKKGLKHGARDVVKEAKELKKELRDG